MTLDPGQTPKTRPLWRQAAGIPALVAVVALGHAAVADPFATALDDAAAGRYGAAAVAFHDLAMAGDADAAYNLSLLFLTGQGVPQNHSEAAFWAWQARLAGLTGAGRLLERLMPELDSAQQRSMAARLQSALSPAAEQGDGAAMLALAVVMQTIHPDADHLGAHAWQSIAAALDVPGATAARDATLQAMDADHRRQAQDHAMQSFRAWCARRAHTAPPPCTLFPVAPEAAHNAAHRSDQSDARNDTGTAGN